MDCTCLGLGGFEIRPVTAWRLKKDQPAFSSKCQASVLCHGMSGTISLRLTWPSAKRRPSPDALRWTSGQNPVPGTLLSRDEDTEDHFAPLLCKPVRLVLYGMRAFIKAPICVKKGCVCRHAQQNLRFRDEAQRTSANNLSQWALGGNSSADLPRPNFAAPPGRAMWSRERQDDQTMSTG